MLPDACFAEVARRYGVAERVLFRWKQEATQAGAPMFVAVEVTDVPLDAIPRQMRYGGGILAQGRQTGVIVLAIASPSMWSLALTRDS
jgi:transposase-like protein